MHDHKMEVNHRLHEDVINWEVINQSGRRRRRNVFKQFAEDKNIKVRDSDVCVSEEVSSARRPINKVDAIWSSQVGNRGLTKLRYDIKSVQVFPQPKHNVSAADEFCDAFGLAYGSKAYPR